MKTKKLFKQKILDLKIFRTEVLVIISEDKEHVARALKYHHGETHKDFDFKGTDAACFFQNGKYPILWIQKLPTTPKEWGTLAHEACHMTVYILENCNVITSHADGETFAYMTEYIVEQVVDGKEAKL